MKGATILVDGTTLEANAAMRSIVRRDTGEKYDDYLTGVAKASGVRTPTRAALARLDRRRAKKGSNEDWKSPSDPDAKKATEAHGPRAAKAEGEGAVLATIAAMPGPDRAIGERLHAIVKASAPALSSRLWYGMPAYAEDGKIVCFFQASRSSTRGMRR